MMNDRFERAGLRWPIHNAVRGKAMQVKDVLELVCATCNAPMGHVTRTVSGEGRTQVMLAQGRDEPVRGFGLDTAHAIRSATCVNGHTAQVDPSDVRTWIGNKEARHAI